jgi:hypothetical protein
MAEAGRERARGGGGEGGSSSVEAAVLARSRGRRDWDGVEDDCGDLITVGEGGFRG